MSDDAAYELVRQHLRWHRQSQDETCPFCKFERHKVTVQQAEQFRDSLNDATLPKAILHNRETAAQRVQCRSKSIAIGRTLRRGIAYAVHALQWPISTGYYLTVHRGYALSVFSTWYIAWVMYYWHDGQVMDSRLIIEGLYTALIAMSVVHIARVLCR